MDTAPGERVAASGCALLVARGTWEQVGLFDERYFFGFEDIDLCLRARAVGIRTLVDGAVAYHQGGGTLAPTSRRRFYFAARNHLLLAHDHRGGGPVAGLARPFTVARAEHRARADLARRIARRQAAGDAAGD